MSGDRCAGDLAFDGASVAVRSAALVALARLAKNPLAQPLMKVVLPTLKPLIWDPALAVRTAMADLLLTIGYAPIPATASTYKIPAALTFGAFSDTLSPVQAVSAATRACVQD